MIRLLALLGWLAVAPVGVAANRATEWKAGPGEWTDASRWTGGPPDGLSRVTIRGESEVRVSARSHVTGVGVLKLGTMPTDRVRLLVEGGKLVCRSDYIHAGEADDSVADIVLASGAVHAASMFYLGGSGEKRVGACRTTLAIRGGSFLCRMLAIGFGQRSEAAVTIEGSDAEAVHVLDQVAVGVPMAGREPSTSTLAFVLDARGVTPITIQSRRTGLRLYREVANRCLLRVSLSAVPPRDDVTLVAAHTLTIGTFDDLPEGSEVQAEYGGRMYRWTLTYRGGQSGCDVVLTKVRGHAADALAAKCREIQGAPKPLWETMQARAESEPRDAPLAFEGAEGFGRHAAGGRGGPTVWVENLDDTGPGSFRAAVEMRGPRTIAFRVSGVIALKSPISIREPFLTVDGESAPDGGITFTGNGFSVQTHDVILRHFRIRPGDETEDTDALGFYDSERCLVDHLSLSWGTDEVLSITGLSDAITVQWCIISEGLNREQHGYAGIAAGERMTWHHNLLAHHVSRVPRFAGIVRADFRNNVLYDWGHTAGYGQFDRVNYVANYLKPGPSTRQRPPRIHLGEVVVGAGSFFLEGNILEGNEAITRENWLGVGFEREARATQAFAAPPVRTTSAESAYEDVLAQAGALPSRRDEIDARIVREVRTGAGRVIDQVSDAGK